MATKEARARATQKFEREHYAKILLRLHKEYDSDIIHRLDEVPSKQGYIKESIREKMSREEDTEEK